jgi:hypothetical protein
MFGPHLSSSSFNLTVPLDVVFVAILLSQKFFTFSKKIRLCKNLNFRIFGGFYREKQKQCLLVFRTNFRVDLENICTVRGVGGRAEGLTLIRAAGGGYDFPNFEQV